MISIHHNLINKVRLYRIKFLFLLFSLQLTLLESCTYNNIGPPPPCSCDAPISKSFQSDSAIMVNTTSGYLMLSFKHGFYKACDELDPALLKDGLMLLASGRLKTTCTREADDYHQEQQTYVYLDHWQASQDSLFSTGAVT